MMNEDKRSSYSVPIIWAVSLAAVGTVGYLLFEKASMVEAFKSAVFSMMTLGIKGLDGASPRGELLSFLLGLGGLAIYFRLIKSLLEEVMADKLEESLTDKKMQEKILGLDNHYVLIGWGRVGRATAGELMQAHLPIVVIDGDASKVAAVKAEGLLAVHGDGRKEDVLSQAGIERAKCLLIATPDDGDNLLTIVTAKSLNPNLFIVARSNDPANASKLVKVGANRVVVPYRISGARMAMMAMKPQVADFIDEIAATDKGHLQIEDLKVGHSSKLVGHNLGETLAQTGSGVVVLAVHRESGKVLVNPEPQTLVESNDRMILMGSDETLSRVRPYFIR
jgi:voltage-gated potassium channel